MQRGQYIPVTPFVVLIPCSSGEREEGMANFLRQGALFVDVRTVRDAELNPKTEGGGKLWKSLAKCEKERLLALIAFRKAMEEKDALAPAKLEYAYRRILVEEFPIPEGSDLAKAQSSIRFFAKLFADEGTSSGVPQRRLAELLTNSLSKARLVLWWKDADRRFLPAVYCPDVATALYVRALLGIVGGRALVVCPHCGEPFLQQRSDQDYCTIRCREAHRVARWRATQQANKTKTRKRR